MMKTVQILLSSYNGEKYISRQIDSILRQKDVEIHLLIRDDGSTDGTRAIIKEYEKKYPANVEVILGENMGWKKSFFTLLQLAGDYDYYAFADQDDYWYEDKEISSIKVMEDDPAEGPKMVQVHYVTTDENLIPWQVQPPVWPVMPSYHDEIFADDLFQGCCMTWNDRAMKIIQKYKPKADFAHDYWVGVVCYLLGKTYLLDEKKFSYIRHVGNSSPTGNATAGQFLRLKKLLSGNNNVYFNIGNDMINGYAELLTEHDLNICMDLKEYKNNIVSKLRILFNFKLRRRSWKGTLFFKLCVLLNKY
jgi:glycosyltransferase involved in cell wall biosynthesis